MHRCSSFLHGSMSKQEAETVILASGKREGQFLVCVRAEDGKVPVTVDIESADRMLFRRNSAFVEEDGSDACDDDISVGQLSLSSQPQPLQSSSRHDSLTLLNNSSSSVRSSSVTSPRRRSSLVPADVQQLYEGNVMFGDPNASVASRKSRNPSVSSITSSPLLRSTLAPRTGRSLRDIEEAPLSPYEEPNEYILSVVYRGAVTHHLLKRKHPGEPFFVNGRLMTACTTLEQTVHALTQVSSFWPAPLIEPVPFIADARDLIAQARRYASHAEYAKAKQRYSVAITSLETKHSRMTKLRAEDTHELASAYEARAEVNLALGEHEAAEDDCQHAIRVEPVWYKGYFTRGRTLIILKKFDAAVKCFQTALSLQSKDSTKVAAAQRALEEAKEQRTKHEDWSALRNFQIAMDIKGTTDSLQHLPVEAVWATLKKCSECGVRGNAASMTCCPSCRTQLFCEHDSRQLQHHSATCSQQQKSAADVTPASDDDTCMQLEKLRSLTLPRNRLRTSQQSMMLDWGQWFYGRLGMSREATTAKHTALMQEYSWVLTSLYCLQKYSRSVPTPVTGNIAVHHWVTVPAAPMPYTAVELCALCPNSRNLTYLQVVPSESGSGSSVEHLNDVLPGDEETPVQVLTVLRSSQPYAVAARLLDSPKPNIILMQEGALRLPAGLFQLPLDTLRSASSLTVLLLDTSESYEVCKAALSNADIRIVESLSGLNPFSVASGDGSTTATYMVAVPPAKQ
eukprot:m.11089 g.11089  ORF g.11089 m.11089 type:complete len:739 (-) comp5485_c0_seq1:252-2468(-)